MNWCAKYLPRQASGSRSLCDLLGLLGVLFFLYLFLLSIGLLGKAFTLFGNDLARQVIDFTSSPLVGLFVGILATSLVQSSSTTTSMTVGMVAGGVLTVETAIPIVMGANIGTSVTNTLVSVAQIGRRQEFRRAFAASTVHDFFNVIAVVLLFPLQYYTNFLGISAEWLANLFAGAGGATFSSPVKAVVKPVVGAAVELLRGSPVLTLILGVLLLFTSLRYLVASLRSLLMQSMEVLFDRYIFRNPLRAFFSGAVLTVLVQSSSITTSLVVPLAGAGILTLTQIYPYTLGANIGTTVTAILAALVAGTVEPVAVAFSHLLFNLCGIAVIVPVAPLRRLPIRLAEWLASAAQRSRWVPLIYIAILFFLIPFLLIILVG